MKKLKQIRPTLTQMVSAFMLGILLLPPQVCAEMYLYHVQKNETLSDILYRENIKPIYGKRGALKVILALNPDLKFSGDQIFPDQEIKLLREEDLAAKLPLARVRAPNAESEVVRVATPVIAAPIATRKKITPVIAPAQVSAQAQTPAPVCVTVVVNPVPPQEPTRAPATVSPAPLDQSLAPVTATAPTASAAVGPAPASAQTPEHPFPFASYELAPAYSLRSISTTDTVTGSTGVLATNLDFATRARYLQHWSEKFTTYVGIDLEYLTFEAPQSATKTLLDSHKFTSGIFFGIDDQLSSTFRLVVEAADEQDLFLRANSTTQVAVDAIAIPTLTAKVDYDFFSMSPFNLGAFGLGAFDFPGTADTYTVNLGESYGAGFYLRRDENALDTNVLNTEIGFITRLQNTSAVKQNDTNIFIHVLFPIGGPKR